MGDLIGAILAPLFAAIGSLIAAILAPVFELLAVIIGAILHFILALVANLLGASWLALHHKGFKRFGYGLMALTSAHLLAGIALPIFSIGAATLLSWAFSPLMMLISLVLLLLSAILVLATQEASPEHEKRKEKAPRHNRKALLSQRLLCKLRPSKAAPSTPQGSLSPTV